MKKSTIMGIVALFCGIILLFKDDIKHVFSEEKITEKNVFIYNWGGYIPSDVIKDFEKETGIKVVYSVFESTEILEAQLLMKAAYDVVFPPAWPVFMRGMAMGLFMPLQKEWLPDKSHFDALILEKISSGSAEDRDKILDYGMPYLWGTTGLGYDKKALLQHDPHLDLESWGMLFDENIVRKIHGERICFIDSAVDVFQAAMMYLGHCPHTQDKNLWNQAIGLVSNIQPYIYSFGCQQVESLANKQSSLLQGFSTYVNMAKDLVRHDPTRDICFAIPKEGAVAWFDMMAIPVHAPNARHAHMFISFILRPEIIGRISNAMKAANAVKEAQKFVLPALRQNPTIFPDAHTMQRIHPDFLPSPELLRHLLRMWLKIKVGYPVS